LVYPNPVKEFIRFVLPEESENLTSVEIFSLNGTLVLEDKGVGISNQLNVSKLASGLYLCKINSGASIQTIKILKE
jgi:aminopeptidase YwaD